MKVAAKRIPPIQIADNLFWIGVSSSSPAHLVTTSEGIVLIDTASDYTVDELLENIAALGFDVREVRHIIHSHGHYDHTGATPKIVALSGAKTYIGRYDYDAVVGNNKRLWASRIPPENEAEFYFEPDVLLDDGDILKVGDVEFRFAHTPGHTLGVMSIFWNAKYNGKEYLAGMFGGAGIGALSDAYLKRDSLPESLREDYVNSVNRLLSEPVELHVGNHPSNNKHNEKAERISNGHNPFIRNNTWEEFLLQSRNSVVNLYDIAGKAKHHVIDAILENKVIVILRGLSRDELIKTVGAIREGGIRCCEVTYDSLGKISDEQTAENIKALVEAFPDMYVGAGTVMNTNQVILTARAGGRFVISPDTNSDVISMTVKLGLVSIPGAVTPTEAATANRAGADFVKMFPIGEFGPSYLKALTAPLSHIRFLAVGGVGVENMDDYFKAGAIGIGVATAIVNREMIKKGNFDGIRELSERYVAAIKASQNADKA